MGQTQNNLKPNKLSLITFEFEAKIPSTAILFLLFVSCGNRVWLIFTQIICFTPIDYLIIRKFLPRVVHCGPRDQ